MIGSLSQSCRVAPRFACLALINALLEAPAFRIRNCFVATLSLAPPTLHSEGPLFDWFGWFDWFDLFYVFQRARSGNRK